jgi:hypothetical protein
MPEQHTILGGKVYVYKRPNSSLSSSFFSCTSDSSSTKRGQQFLLTSPRIPCAFGEPHHVLELVVGA